MNEASKPYADPNRISIVTPVYNAEKLVGKMIRSIQKQTYENWRLILVNDGSKDGSARVLDSFAAKDPRITVIHQTNQGSVMARSNGLFSEQAQANPWITFADADDILPPRALEALLAPTKDPKVELVCGDTKRLVWNHLASIGYQYPCFKIDAPKAFDHDDIMNELFIGFYGLSLLPASLCAKLYRTDMITQAYLHRLPIRFFGEDMGLTIQVFAAVKHIVLIPDAVYGYRLGGGTSRFMPDMMNDCLLMYNYKKELAESLSLQCPYRYYMDIEMMNNIITWIGSCMTKGKWETEAVNAEIERLRALPEIMQSAAYAVQTAKNLSSPAPALADLFLNGSTDAIRIHISTVWGRWQKKTLKTFLKKFL